MRHYLVAVSALGRLVAAASGSSSPLASPSPAAAEVVEVRSREDECLRSCNGQGQRQIPGSGGAFGGAPWQVFCCRLYARQSTCLVGLQTNKLHRFLYQPLPCCGLPADLWQNVAGSLWWSSRSPSVPLVLLQRAHPGGDTRGWDAAGV